MKIEKITLTKNMIFGTEIKPSGEVLSIPDQISEEDAIGLIEMGKASIWEGEVAIENSLRGINESSTDEAPNTLIIEAEEDLTGGDAVIQNPTTKKAGRPKK